TSAGCRIPVDLALGVPATASSVEQTLPKFAAQFVNDGNTATHWSSGYDDRAWIYLDLGKSYSIGRVRIVWGACDYGLAYRIDISKDASKWRTVYSTTAGKGGTEIIDISDSRSGRFVRMKGIKRATQRGYSIVALEVFTDLAVHKTTWASSVEYH